MQVPVSSFLSMMVRRLSRKEDAALGYKAARSYELAKDWPELACGVNRACCQRNLALPLHLEHTNP